MTGLAFLIGAAVIVIYATVGDRPIRTKFQGSKGSSRTESIE